MNVCDSRRRGLECGFMTVDWLLASLLVLLLTACGSSQPPPVQAAVDIHKGDACVVCGMYIDAGPGPRAEAWVQGSKVPLKFGSTRDFFAYVLDPENQSRLQQLMVQDSARINWQHPSNEASTLVDARSAWYVAWQPLSGLMGPTFGSFAKREDAETFVREQGGEILSFSEVTPTLTSLLGYACPTEPSPAFVLAKSCKSALRPAGSLSAAPDRRIDLLRSSNAAPHEANPSQQALQHDLLDPRAH